MSDIKILLIDDDLVDIKAHKRLLRFEKNYAFDIQEADSVELAINKLKADDYDCVLLDYSMPGYTGIDLLDKINAINPDHDIPIILLTGQGDEKIAVDAFKKGICDYLVKSDINSKKLTDTIINALDKKDHETKQKVVDAELKELAFKDPLTKLLNRRGFKNIANKSISYCKRHNVKTAILYVDLDDFKKVNDNYGHLTGDQLVVEVADRIEQVVRNEDIVARFGGDEFVIYLSHIKHIYDVQVVANKIIHSIQCCQIVKDQSFKSCCSIGYCIYDNDLSLNENIQNADKALFKAKSTGKNKSVMA